MGLFSRMKANLQNRKDQKESNRLKAEGTTGGKSPVYTKSDLDKEISEIKRRNLKNPKISLDKKTDIEQMKVDAPKGEVRKTNQTPPPKRPLTRYQKTLAERNKIKEEKMHTTPNMQAVDVTAKSKNTKTQAEIKAESEKTSANNARIIANQKAKAAATEAGKTTYTMTKKDGTKVKAVTKHHPKKKKNN
jgi:hypothetical protein